VKISNFIRDHNVVLTAALAVVIIAGCGKKPEPAKPQTEVPKPPPAAPTASISVSPNSIERGQSAEVRWSTTNATSVSLNGGYVSGSGSQTVSPNDSTTYNLTAKGDGGTATDSARLTVTSTPQQVQQSKPPVISETDAQWFARNVKDIYFDYDKYDVRDDAKATIAADAAALIQKNWNIQIQGHCDERGSTEYNLTLGDERAVATRDALIAAGVPANRLSVISYGKEKPVCTESTEECWQRNRRAHFEIKK